MGGASNFRRGGVYTFAKNFNRWEHNMFLICLFPIIRMLYLLKIAYEEVHLYIRQHSHTNVYVNLTFKIVMIIDIDGLCFVYHTWYTEYMVCINLSPWC